MALSIQPRASLVALNTFGVAARAEFLLEAHSADDLAQIDSDPRFAGLPRMVLGGGSNVLLTQDFPGVVVRFVAPGIDALGDDSEHWLIQVAAGENWHALVEFLVTHDRPGLENLALIPGLAGAAPIQNIGAYGLELAERLHAVDVWDSATRRVVRLDVAACAFGYRDSVFKRDAPGARVVTGIVLALPKRWQPVLGYTELANALAADREPVSARRIFDAVVAIRRRKLPDPAVIGNAGSFFKNPIVPEAQCRALKDRFPSLVSYALAGGRAKLAAGWLIEACGLKGATRGRAGIHEKHALVLVNRGGATGREILDLAREVQDKVREKFGVMLEPEPVVV
jgi:UDP-N-acetylmuramate dehydrogenase